MAGNRLLSLGHLRHSPAYLLKRATKKVSKIEQLLEEKIDDQKWIINLQQRLLKQKEEGLKCIETVVQSTVQKELKSGQTAVKTEMKSYS